LLATALFGIGNSSNAFLVLRTKVLGASLTTTILIYASFNLVAALISYPAGFLSDRFGRRNILILAFAISLAIYLGFALNRNVALLAVLFVCYGLYQGIFRSVGKALASDYVPEQLRASGIGLVQHDRGVVRSGGEPCCRFAVGPGRDMPRSFYSAQLRCGWRYRIACVGSGSVKT
jgi:MFS family permease